MRPLITYWQKSGHVASVPIICHLVRARWCAWQNLHAFLSSGRHRGQRCMKPVCLGTMPLAIDCAIGSICRSMIFMIRGNLPSCRWGFVIPAGLNAVGICHPARNVHPNGMMPLREHLPDIGLTLLIGQYAQGYYLGTRRSKTMTETVHRFGEFLPENILPMPHPSWRNTAWMKKNPWFESDLLPVLRMKVHDLLGG